MNHSGCSIDPAGVDAHVVGHHVRGEADAARPRPVAEVAPGGLAAEVVGDAVVHERVGGRHGLGVAAQLLDALRGVAAFPQADEPQPGEAPRRAAGRAPRPGSASRRPDRPSVCARELVQPHVGALGHEHQLGHPVAVRAEGLGLVRRGPEPARALPACACARDRRRARALSQAATLLLRRARPSWRGSAASRPRRRASPPSASRIQRSWAGQRVRGGPDRLAAAAPSSVRAGALRSGSGSSGRRSAPASASTSARCVGVRSSDLVVDELAVAQERGVAGSRSRAAAAPRGRPRGRRWRRRPCASRASRSAGVHLVRGRPVRDGKAGLEARQRCRPRARGRGAPSSARSARPRAGAERRPARRSWPRRGGPARGCSPIAPRSPAAATVAGAQHRLDELLRQRRRAAAGSTDERVAVACEKRLLTEARSGRARRGETGIPWPRHDTSRRAGPPPLPETDAARASSCRGAGVR